MRRRGRKKDDSWLMGLILFVGAPVFLLMEHPVVFWLVFVPLALLFVVSLIKFFANGRNGIGDFVTAMLILVVMGIALMIVCMP